MSPSKHPWTVPVALSEIPESGKHIRLSADEATRAQVAAFADLRALPRLEATFDVTRHGKDGVRVRGEVSATVGQNCVVTLDPLDNDVKESVDIAFTPSSGTGASDDGDAEDVVALDMDDTEPLTGNTIDLGALAIEFMMLGIDHYPRKPGAALELPAVEDDTPHPFAALAALNKGSDTKE